MRLKSIAAAVLLVLAMATSAVAAYPDRALQGVITWGAGGGCDTASRAITPMAAEALGKTIVLQNRLGATGAIGFTQVASSKADGYTLLYAAENPCIYKVAGLSTLDYDDFEPLILSMGNPAVFVVPKDSPYKTFKDFIEGIKRGDKFQMGSSGYGALAFMASSMMETIHGIKFNQVHFDGEGPAMPAIMGGHIDGMGMGLTSCVTYAKSGAVRALAVFNDKRVASLPDVPTVMEFYKEEYAPYLPWGAFYGVFVKKGTPEPIVKTLQAAFKKAFDDQRFQDFATKLGAVPLGLSGDEARAYIRQNQIVGSWLMYDTGQAKFSPEKFGIPKPSAKYSIEGKK